MSDSNLPPPLALVRSATDPQLNGIIIEAMASGFYTLLFSQAIWKLYRKGGKWRYSSALIIMWIATIVSFMADWIKSSGAFVFNNSSPLAIFMYMHTPTFIFGFIAGTIANTISDAIIIWRCHILWQNKIILSLLTMFLCITIGLEAYSNLLFPNAPVNKLIEALGILSSFITTVSATSLIALKIFLVTRQTHRHHHYTKITEILIQSAAIVSITTLGMVICSLVDFVHPFNLSTTGGRFGFQLGDYIVYAQIPIEGIAPTLIAFRVAKEQSQPELNTTTRSASLSRLTFRRTAHNVNANSEEITTTGPE